MEGLPSQSLSFYYSKVLTSQSYEISDALLLGQPQSQYFRPPLVYTPLLPSEYWEFEINDFRVNGVSSGLCRYLLAYRGQCVAALDSGTSIIAGPAAFVNDLATVIGLAQDCSNVHRLPILSIDFGGSSFVLEPLDYVIYSDGECSLAIMGLDVPPPRGPLLVLGNTFIRKYFTSLDFAFNRLGFALAV